MNQHSRSEGVLNTMLWLAFAAWVFVLFTNALPLVQLGWLEPLKSKTRYANLVRIATLLFFALLSILAFKKRTLFTRLDLPRLWNSASPSQIEGLVWILTLIYFVSGSLIGFTRHFALQTRAFDLGIFDQVLWNTLQGDFLLSSLKDNTCLLGDHFSPFLIFLTPFYALFKDPITLLILQAAALSSCIPVVYKFAQQQLKDPRAAFCFAAAFFLFYPERSALHEDFHPEVMVQPLLFLTFILMKQRKWALFLGCLAICLSAKENFAGIVFIFGLSLFLFEKKKLLGGLLAAFSVFYLAGVTRWIIPSISGKSYLYCGFYQSILKHPAAALHQILSLDALSYVMKLFSPLLFLSFLHPPSLLLTLPVLAQNLLSENEVTRSFSYHYTAGLSPFVFISAIMGWHWLSARLTGSMKVKALSLLMLFSVLRSGPSEYYYFYNSLSSITPLTKTTKAAIANIPNGASVLTHNNLIPQLSRRKHIFQFEHNPSPLKIEQALELGVEIVILDRQFWEPKSKPFEETVADFQKENFTTFFKNDDLVIFTKERAGKEQT